MLIHLHDTTSIDTDRDLGPEERHILQKLLCYKVIATSLQEFREQKAKAFHVGWNNSGPVPESSQMAKICSQLERELNERLHNG